MRISVTRAMIPRPKVHSPRTHAAVAGRWGHSANSANTTRYSSVRSAPSSAAPLSSAHAIDAKLQAVKAASAASATRTATGCVRQDHGSVKPARPSSAITTIAPSAHRVTGWPPSSGVQATKTATARRVGAVTGAARNRLSTVRLPLELLVDRLDGGVEAAPGVGHRALQPALRGEDRARVVAVELGARPAQRGAVVGDLADEPPVQGVEALGRVDRAEVADGGAHGGLVGQQRLLVLLGRARRRD